MTEGVRVRLHLLSHLLCLSSKQTVYLPVIGLVPEGELKPGDLVGTNKDSFLILEKLPAE